MISAGELYDLEAEAKEVPLSAEKCQDLIFNPKCEHGVEVAKVECFECAYEDE